MVGSGVSASMQASPLQFLAHGGLNVLLKLVKPRRLLQLMHWGEKLEAFKKRLAKVGNFEATGGCRTVLSFHCAGNLVFTTTPLSCFGSLLWPDTTAGHFGHFAHSPPAPLVQDTDIRPISLAPSQVCLAHVQMSDPNT